MKYKIRDIILLQKTKHMSYDAIDDDSSAEIGIMRGVCRYDESY